MHGHAGFCGRKLRNKPVYQAKMARNVVFLYDSNMTI